MSPFRTALLLLICLPSLATGTEPLVVVTSVAPMKTLIEQVSGDLVRVQALVGPGHNPATYDPTPQQIAALSNAALYAQVGLPFEGAWLGRIRAANPRMVVLDTTASLTLRQQDAHSDGVEADTTHPPNAGADPHLWTSPLVVRQMIGTIRDALTVLDGAHADRYAQNHDRFASELTALDAELRALLAPIRGRHFLVFHPGWGYFADAYGLVQVAIEHQGKEPGARSLAGLVAQSRARDIRAIFVQPQFDRRMAARIAENVGATVLVADPLAPDYADNLRRVARQMVAALAP